MYIDLIMFIYKAVAKYCQRCCLVFLKHLW